MKFSEYLHNKWLQNFKKLHAYEMLPDRDIFKYLANVQSLNQNRVNKVTSRRYDLEIRNDVNSSVHIFCQVASAAKLD